MDVIIQIITHFASTFLNTVIDVIPITCIIFGFQYFVIRKKIPNLRRVLAGFFYVIVGLALFLEGLEDALFPIGKMMATQLTDPHFILQTTAEIKQGVEIHWSQ